MSRRPGLPGVNLYQKVKPSPKKPDPIEEKEDEKIPFPKEIVTPDYRHDVQDDDDMSLITKIEIGLGITVGVFILLAVLEK